MGLQDAWPGPPGPMQATVYRRFDFPTCVHYALTHSDELLRNRLDIQLRSADLKDAHAEVLPTFSLRSYYYIERASNQNDQSPFGVQVVMSNWNPYLALLKIQAQNVIVDIARTGHKLKISQGVGHMARLFYQIQQVEQELKVRKHLLGLMQRKFEYVHTRHEQGEIDDIELRLLRNTVRGRRLQVKELEIRAQSLLAQLKLLMGYHPDQNIPLDTRNVTNQLLAGFQGENVTFADIQGRNLDLKILAKKEQVQSHRVTGAYVALMPQPSMMLQGIQNQVDTSDGTNLSVGFTYQLWDGFKAVRDIRRQKITLRKLGIDRRQRSRELYNEFQELRSGLKLAKEYEAYHLEQLNLARLAEERTFMFYKEGSASFREYIDARIARAESQIGYLVALQKRVLSLIDLATLAGGLNRYNAAIRF
jgi:outer membrane protein TolC